MQPETEAGLTQSILNDDPEAPSKGLPSDGLVIKKVVSENGRGPGSLYNLVKALAKEHDPDLAVCKLRAAARADTERVNVKNSKGSTALHACGYLRRWDLASVLLEAGADPVIRNAAGHSFFLTAVRSPEVPWESLFVGHAELLDKHRKFLEKEPRFSRGRSREINEDAEVSALRTSRPPRAALQSVAPFVQELTSISDAFELGEWTRFVSEMGTTRFDASVDAVSRLINTAPIDAVDLALARGLQLDEVGAEVLCRRAVAEGWAVQGRSWVLVGQYLSLAAQREVLARAVFEQQFVTAEALARAGWAYDEELIEGLEDAGAYEVADALIDLQSRPPTPIGRPVGRNAVRELRGPAQSVTGHAVKSKRARNVAGSKGAGRRPKKDKRSSSMVANLDRPSREASDFEYRERQPQAKAPLIIVKKARAPVIPPIV